MRGDDANLKRRLDSIDALRGVVMVLMALDHTRDFFHRDAMRFSPTDLAKATPFLFLTRWVTHFCLPVFMFTAGIGIFLWWQRGSHSKGQLASFLTTRGIWFVLLELTVMQFAYNFRFSNQVLLLLLILWIFGICLLAMAGLIWLPMRWLLGFSLLVIAAHNCLDGVSPFAAGAARFIWSLVHQPGLLMLGGRPVLVTYTLLPWIGVMGAGFCFGQILRWDPAIRQQWMLRTGGVAVVLFVILRALNGYGDPVPWAVQKSGVLTVLSFLNCTKYPASLDFLLMTLGPALLVLRFFDRHLPLALRPLITFGRVPLFFFVLHFYLIHGLASLMALLRYGGKALQFVFQPLPSMGGPTALFPPDFGYSLETTYVVWVAVVVSLYPLCRWYARVKAESRGGWLRYL